MAIDTSGSCAGEMVERFLGQTKSVLEELTADGKKELDGKCLSEDMEKILKERRSYIANAAEGGDVIPLTVTREEGVTAQVIVPIVSGGDCLGAVAVLSKEEGAKMDGSDMNLARLTADILANQFE